jgi:hypothetical protein
MINSAPNCFFAGERACRIFVSTLLTLVSTHAFSQEVALSAQAQISLITFGPDQGEFYEAFGHSAVRIMDPAHGIDYAYNYGVFSFNQPNFYLNFTRGHLYYQLGVYPYPDFRDAYISANRFVHEQVLQLTPGQRQKIFDYLEWNARPENKVYNYDYFYNNCSSRIRDVFADVLKGEIQFDGSYIKTDYTIRQLTDLYLDRQPWGDLGIDIGLGSTIDRKATPYEHMFLPDYLESGFDHAFINLNGTSSSLVREKTVVFQSLPEEEGGNWFHPWTVFGFILVLALALTVFDVRRKRLSTWFDVTFLWLTGLLGVFLLFLWFGTDHHACAKNYNLLWALPTHLFAGVLLLRKNKPAWLPVYFLATAGICLLLLLTWPILPQFLNYFLMPYVAAMLVRSLTIFKLLKLEK